jgi:hypothetical protein
MEAYDRIKFQDALDKSRPVAYFRGRAALGGLLRNKIRRILTASLLGFPGLAMASPYYQHASFLPSSVQGQLTLGLMRTNAGYQEVSELPIFYHTAAVNGAWYDLSHSPLACGGAVGRQSASFNCGAILDLGPQLIEGLEYLTGKFSLKAQAGLAQFFNCSASANACGTLSAGALSNVTVEDNGVLARGAHDLFKHPIGYFIGPSILFGGPKATQ